MRTISRKTFAIAGAVVGLACSTAVLADMGRTAGSHGVSPSGAATYTIPIWVQPGAKGIQPSLAFNYSSQAGNGTMGVGWSLSGVSSIDRCAWTAVEDGEDRAVSVTASDRFCIGGKKLRITSGPLANYGTTGAVYQTSLADFSRVTSSGSAGTGPQSFVVHTKGGQILEYGATADSRIVLSGSTVFRWMLNKVSDREGNSYVITYTTDNSVGRVPLTVSWGATTAGGSTYQYRASFNYSNKANPYDFVAARQGTDSIVTRQRLDSVTIGYSASGSSHSTKRQYILSYLPSPTTGLSRLTEVKECGATTSVCLKPTTIAYQNGAPGVSNSPTTAVLSAGAIAGKYDFNGDGKSDIAYLNGGTWKVAFSTGAAFAAAVDTGITVTPMVGRFISSNVDGFLVAVGGTWSYVGYNGSAFVTTPTGTPVTSGTILSDYNGDGLEDFVWSSTTSGPGGWTGFVNLRLNTTVGNAAVPSFGTTVYTPLAQSLGTFGGNVSIVNYSRCPVERNCDINGDGGADLTVVVTTTHNCTGGPGGCQPITTGYDLVTGGFGYFLTNGIANTASPYLGLRFNSDQCTDTIRLATTSMKVMGCGNGAATSVTLPAVPIAVLDWDGDRRSDLIVNSGGVIGVYKSTGSTSTPFSSLLTTSIPFNSGCSYFPADVEGDGLDELVCVSGSNVMYYSHNGGGSVGSAGGTNVFATQIPDLLSTITDGFGLAVSPSYVSTAQSNYTKGTGTTLPLIDSTEAMTVVGRVRVSDGISVTFDVNYSYKGARRHGKLAELAPLGDLTAGNYVLGAGGQFAGFEEITATDSRNGLRQKITYEQLFPLTRMVKKSEALQSDATPIKRTTNTNLFEPLDSTTNNQRYFPYVSQVDTESYEVGGPLNGQLTTSSVRTLGYSSFVYGNISTDTTVTTDRDSVSLPSTLNSTWTTGVTNTYADPLTSNEDWCVGMLTQVQVANSSTAPGTASVTRTVGFSADATNPSKCRIKTKTIEPSSPKYKVVETYQFDAFGNVESVAVVGKQPIGGGAFGDMPTRTTSVNWGSTGQFPVTVTDASGAVTATTYNPDTGTVQKVADPNSTTANLIETSFQYDDFNRKKQVTRPDGTYTTWTYVDCASSGCVYGWHDLTIAESVYDRVGTLITDGASYFDAFDRVLVTRARLLNGTVWDGTYQWKELAYDEYGRVAHQYMPCKTASATASCRSAAATFSYDLNDRVTQTSRPRSALDSTPQTMTFGYAGRTNTVQDPQGKLRTHVFNPTLTLRQVKDANNYAVNMAYDAAGSVTQITDSQSVTRLSNVTVEYGVRPFQVAATDSALGPSTSTFNSLGELVGWTDAKSQSFSATYDAISRMVSRTEPGATTEYVYGNNVAAYNVGKLVSASSIVGGETYAENYTYDNRGRLSRKSVAIPADATYHFDFAYETNKGWLDTLTYPESTPGYRLAIKNEYQNGVLQKISDANAPALVFWSANASNAWGQVTQDTLGNGVVTNRVYDAVTSWLSSIQSGPAGNPTSIQNQSYLYDLAGNVTQRQNNKLGLTETFIYGSATDNLYRLEHSVLNNGVTSSTNLALTYDLSGSILSKDEPGQPDQLISQSVTWTSFNYPSVISTATESASFSYGPDRRRWRMNFVSGGTSETTYYIGGLLEKVAVGSNSEFRHTIAAGSHPVAIYSRSGGGNVLRYVLRDHQGSVESFVDSSGATIVNESFSAFGERRNSATWVGTPPDRATLDGISRQGYTYQTVLGSMGLNHMNGRVQDAVTGRFMSADPFITDAYNTQNYNRYSYLFNNPLSLIDPSGFGDEDLDEVVVTGTRSNDDDDDDPGKPDERSNQCDNAFGGSLTDGACNAVTSQVGMGSAIASSMAARHARDRLPCSAASATKPAEGGVLVQLMYTEATSAGRTIGRQSHAFVVAVDIRTGQMYASRGGPGSGPGGGANGTGMSLVAVSGVLNANFPDQLSETHASQVVGYLNVPFQNVVQYMNDFADVTNRNFVIYSGPRSNSNSYAFTLTEGMGFDRPEPAVPAMGHSTNRVDPNLTCKP